MTHRQKYVFDIQNEPDTQFFFKYFIKKKNTTTTKKSQN